jgi:hypothetical protein
MIIALKSEAAVWQLPHLARALSGKQLGVDTVYLVVAGEVVGLYERANLPKAVSTNVVGSNQMCDAVRVEVRAMKKTGCGVLFDTGRSRFRLNTSGYGKREREGNDSWFEGSQRDGVKEGGRGKYSTGRVLGIFDVVLEG